MESYARNSTLSRVNVGTLAHDTSEVALLCCGTLVVEVFKNKQTNKQPKCSCLKRRGTKTKRIGGGGGLGEVGGGGVMHVKAHSIL